MYRKSAVIAFEVLIGVIGVTALLAGLAFWRLSTGPVDLDFLTPEIEAALSDPARGLAVEIGATQLTWEEGKRTVNLHTRNVQVRDSAGSVLAALPDIVLRLSLRALVQGTIAPTLVEVLDARLSVLRRADGTFQFGPWREGTDGTATADAARQDAAEGDLFGLMPDILDQLLGSPSPDDPLSFLRVVRIAGGRITVDDRKLGSVWTAPYADIELRRHEEGLAGELALKLDLGGRQSNLFVLLDYGRASKQIDLAARFSDLVPEAIVPFVPGLRAVSGLTMPMAGSVSASLSALGALRKLDFDIRGAGGAFQHESLFVDPVAIRELRATGNLDAGQRRITLESASVELGSDGEPGPSLELAGRMTGAEEGFRGDLTLELTAALRRVAMDDLGRYWPPSLAPNPREWVLENIAKGMTTEASLSTSLTAPDGDFSQAHLHDLSGRLDYSGLDVHYLRPMPPISSVSGTADFDGDRITFRPAGGTFGKLEVRDTFVEITGLAAADEIMKIDVPIVGPLRDALELLDHDRLKLVRRLGLDPGSFRGSAAARIRFDFPLLKDLTFDHIKIAALANLEEVEAKGLVLGQDVAQGSLQLALDTDGMHLTGPLVFGGIPMDVRWAESFADDAVEQTRIEIDAPRLDAQGRSALGISLAPYLTGPVAAIATVHRGGDKRTTIDASLDLQEARLQIPEMVWRKPAGAPGTATLTLELDDDRLVRISPLDVEADTLRLRGSAAFDSSGKTLSRLDFDKLKVGGTELNGAILEFTGGGTVLSAGKGKFDVSPFLSGDPAPRDDQGADQPTQLVSPEPSAAPTQPDEEQTPLRLSAVGLDAVIFGPDRYLENVNVDMERSRLGWEKIQLTGTVPKHLWHSERGTSGADLSGETPKILSLNFRPAGDGGKSLLITTPDMGAVLRALNAIDTMNGGRLEIVGTSDGPLPGSTLSGRLEGHDYVLVGAPNLARLLTVASLTGINDLLNGDGIRFSRMVGKFTFKDGLMRSDLMRAYGPALGLTAKGQLDFERAETDFQGTIVPAYTVNRILGGIPLLGPLLTGGEGEGVFAATYRAKGVIGDLDVSVNTLAALAPGFLRSLFSGSSVGDDEPSALPPKIDP